MVCPQCDSNQNMLSCATKFRSAEKEYRFFQQDSAIARASSNSVTALTLCMWGLHFTEVSME